MNKTEKIPVIKYLCYLLVVSILFTGVTFSRFTGATSGNTEATLSQFVCSYTIDDMSSTSFSNADYWLSDGVTAMNTARSMRFTVRNYTVSEDGSPDRISDIDLQSTIRLYAPAEFAGNLAIQVAEVDEDGTYITKTPQYVLKDLIYEGDDFRKSGEVNTEDFVDYNARTDPSGKAVDEVLQINSSFAGTKDSHTGTLSAYCAETKNHLTITATMSEAEYSVGFYRQDAGNANQSAHSLYLDCVKVVPFYTVDISLPSMLLKRNTAETYTYVLFLTVLSKTENDDFDAVWQDSYDDLLEEPTKGEKKIFNSAIVTGYHFDRKAELYEWKDGDWVSTGSETTIRIKKEYDYENGGAILSYYHVAPLAEGAASVAHPITDFYDENGESVTVSDFSNVTSVHNKWGTCSNGGKSGYIGFADIPDDPLYSSYQNQDTGAYDYEIGEALSKGYSTKLNVLFIQASESGEV